MWPIVRRPAVEKACIGLASSDADDERAVNRTKARVAEAAVTGQDWTALLGLNPPALAFDWRMRWCVVARLRS